MLQVGDHPIKLMKLLCEKYPDRRITVYLQKYRYKPWVEGGYKTPEYEDKTTSYTLLNGDTAGMERVLRTLQPDQDLSITSDVRSGNNCSWPVVLPLIDFHGELSQWHLEALRSVVPDNLLEDLYLFNSGRSMHGYILQLISFTEWQEFMGTLLLTEYKDKPKVVDTRWIGHCLRRGYGCLRWSATSEKYLHTPQFLGTFTDLERSFEGGGIVA